MNEHETSKSKSSKSKSSFEKRVKQSFRLKEYRRRNFEEYGNSQRVITIARINRKMRQSDLAALLFCSPTVISHTENGYMPAPWHELERVMPELAEMREKGCAAYCDTPHICRIAPCKYTRRGRPRKENCCATGLLDVPSVRRKP